MTRLSTWSPDPPEDAPVESLALPDGRIHFRYSGFPSALCGFLPGLRGGRWETPAEDDPHPRCTRCTREARKDT